MRHEQKSFEIKAAGASVEENRMRCEPSIMGVMDRDIDVIFPGSFKGCLKTFTTDGFVAVGHSWRQLPVAMPLSAREDGNKLLCEAEFHSTEEGQNARTVCVERMAKGLSVFLSVGFMPDYEKGVHYFESGENLLRYAKDNGYDLSLFDTKGIRACKSYCRGITKIDTLYEFSIVPVPANPAASVTEAKGLDELTRRAREIKTERECEEFLRDAGLPRAFAVALTLHGFKAASACQRDSEGDEDASAMEEPPAIIDAANEKDAEELLLRALSMRSTLIGAHL